MWFSFEPFWKKNVNLILLNFVKFSATERNKSNQIKKWENVKNISIQSNNLHPQIDFRRKLENIVLEIKLYFFDKSDD